MAREEAKEQARNAGILGTLANLTGSFNAPTSPYGRDTALGTDPTSALGALMGDQIGENFGFGGLGLRGTGRGGGGTGEGTIGLGNFGTIGHGGGRGTGSGYGSGAGGLGGRAAKVPQIRGGNADVRGSLSAEVIRRVVRRHMNEVRFCYEQELNQRPDLEGRVAVGFIISPTGSVQSATVNESTLQNQRVEGCITTAVRRWGFPAPDGGGIVVVTYPFLLSPAGT
ncbi:MAG: AgmX/PglI C-terminal domain-containing protein [Polyangiales bacterium]